MNDIVQRLRDSFHPWMGEAADLIEAQAAEIERYRVLALQTPSWERAEAAEAEVVRMREALKQIADIDADQDDYKLAYEDVQEIAYDAIKPALGVKP